MSRGANPEPNALFSHGERFGSLTVLERAKTTKARGPQYKVGCACGFRFVVKGSHLRKGRVTACLKCRTAALGQPSSIGRKR